VALTRAARWVAFFFLSAFSLSCREDAGAPPDPQPIPFSLRFSAGDTFLYDAVLIDVYGYTIPSSRSSATWRILSTGGTLPGFSNVITIQDSAFVLRSTSSRIDTVLMAVNPSGDIYRYGFLATIARIRQQPVPPDQWECIAAFSVGPENSWVVGYQDEERSLPVIGRISGTTNMSSVKVKGQQTVFPAYRVDLSGRGFDYSYWVADSPTAFVLIRLEPNDTEEGAQLTLSEIR